MDAIGQLNAALEGRYVVSREIGAGGMATVYLAQDLRHQRPVAIKVLRPDLAASLGAERFLREVRIAAQLQHPHILPVFDSGEAGTLLWYAMPFVEGETLREKLARDGALPVTDAVRVIREVADALAKAHRAGVVHRDVKPENILFADGHALVADFGVAKAVREASAPGGGMTTAGISLGTPGYMAPEQVAADPAADQRMDIYSLGIVGYELLTGVAPFAHLPPAQQLSAHVTTVPAPVTDRRPECPPALAAAIARCLEKRPGDRPQSAEELISLVDGISGPQPGVAPVVEKPGGMSARGRAMLGVGAAALLLVAGAYAVRHASNGKASAASGERSLAVLPLANLQGDSATNYFSDGISEEILSVASKLPGLRVAGRSVSFRFRGRDVDVKRIGRELGVSHVLEGSVQKAANRVRVNVSLTDARTGLTTWSERYDRELTDIFAVEDQISQEIARALDVQLARNGPGTAAPGAKTSVEAHDQYLLGLSAQAAREVRKAADHFSGAIAMDSGYAAAYAGLASALVLFPEYNLTTNADSTMASARRAAHRALALDSSQATAHLALAYGAKIHERNFAFADTEYGRALALDPNMAEAHHWHGELLVELGRFNEAQAEFARSLRQDPASPATEAMMAAVLFRKAPVGGPTMMDSAVAHCRRMSELAQRVDIFAIEFACGTAAARGRRWAAAHAHLTRAGRALGDSTYFLTLESGVENPARRPAAIAMLDRIPPRGAGPMDQSLAALWYLALDEPAKAMASLEQAERQRSPYLSYLEVLDFSPLAAEPRFRALRKRLGYPS